MITLRLKTIFLGACFVEALWLLAAQTLGNTLLLLPCLVCFLALAVWAALKNMAMPVILFFLPFAPLLKIRPGSYSFFTFALLAIYAIYLVTGSRNVRVFHLIPALCLILLTLVVKVAYGYDIDTSYLLFAVTLLLVPYVVHELNVKYDFYWLTVFFVLGIALAAVTSQALDAFPTISRYIGINTSLGMVRRSGYYGDPNFYSAHITAALSGVAVLFLNNVKKSKLFLLSLMAILMVYCGLLSVSKSFLLILVSMVLFWVVDLMFRQGKLSFKVTTLFLLAVAVLFILSSTVFSDMLDLLLGRIDKNANLSDFTTGRTDLWMQYWKAITEDPWVLSFGQGYTDVTVDDRGRGSHSTIIQCLYQFGLVGSTLFLAWAGCFLRTLLGRVQVRWGRICQLAILLIGTLGPWVALEYIFFDELFLVPIYLCAAILFTTGQTDTDTELTNSEMWVEQ